MTGSILSEIKLKRKKKKKNSSPKLYDFLILHNLLAVTVPTPLLKFENEVMTKSLDCLFHILNLRKPLFH